MLALELYRGQAVCRLLRVDQIRGAVLLERIVPDTPLRKAVSDVEQLRIGSQLVRNLPFPVDPSTPLPRYPDLMDHAFDTVRNRFKASKLFLNSIGAALEMASEVPVDGNCLLHGDLHHDNILLGSHGEWRVIDPQGVIGSPIMECGRFIQNHALDSNNRLDLEKAHSTVDHVATAINQPARQVWIALFILHVLSFCWGFEMNYAPEVLIRGADGCAAILASIPN